MSLGAVGRAGCLDASPHRFSVTCARCRGSRCAGSDLVAQNCTKGHGNADAAQRAPEPKTLMKRAPACCLARIFCVSRTPRLILIAGTAISVGAQPQPRHAHTGSNFRWIPPTTLCARIACRIRAAVTVAPGNQGEARHMQRSLLPLTEGKLSIAVGRKFRMQGGGRDV